MGIYRRFHEFVHSKKVDFSLLHTESSSNTKIISQKMAFSSGNMNNSAKNSILGQAYRSVSVNSFFAYLIIEYVLDSPEFFPYYAFSDTLLWLIRECVKSGSEGSPFNVTSKNSG